jgi:hypothetical protein
MQRHAKRQHTGPQTGACWLTELLPCGGRVLRGLLISWYGKGCPLPGLQLWLRCRWLVFILLGVASMGYALFLVRAADTINRASFYWFFYSGALLLFGGLVEQGHNLERRS